MPDYRSQLPSRLYTAAQCGELDRLVSAEYNLPSIVLMKRAGRAAYRALLARWPAPGTITVCCGAGNNAGDGYVVAGLAAEHNLAVRIIQVGDTAKLTPTAAEARRYAERAGVPIDEFSDAAAFASQLAAADGVIVDALLGTGLRGDVRQPYADVIAAINASPQAVVALDIPSGLDADRGVELGCAIRADLTVTFIGLKRGLLTGRAPALTGPVLFRSLDVPDALYDRVPADGAHIDLADYSACLSVRPRDSHKGAFGHVLIVGGDRGMGGAVAMAGEAAARTGAGLVTVATRADHINAILACRPELMAKAVNSAADLEPLFERASVIVLGPGLGRGDWSRELLNAALATDLPLVVDADGLNLLSENPKRRDNWVLTPHPGEAARLLAWEPAEVNGDRFAAVRSLAERYGGTALLKGAGTLIAHEARTALAAVGNPGMASGGMGDVLSGIVGGLLAQRLSPAEAAELGVLLHGKAADMAAATHGERGLLATDLFHPLRTLINGGAADA